MARSTLKVRLPLWGGASFPAALAIGLIATSLVACGGAQSALPTATAVPTATPTVSPTGAPVPTAPAPKVDLPNDEGVHLTPLEWWYFNGRLSDEAGREYSYHFVTFQSVTPNGLTLRLVQLSWADHDKNVYLTSEKPDLPVALKTSGEFDFVLSGWAMRGDGKDYSLAFDVGDYSVDLQAVSAKPPVLHQGTGLVNLGGAGDSYYYSRTRLETAGAITIGGEKRTVNGTAWMDHQWGNFSTKPVGWDWLSLQLNDGAELMVSLVWDPDGHKPIVGYGTYIPADTAAAHLDDGDISLAATGSWTSPATGTAYPMGWSLSVKSLDLDLSLTPVQQDAEFAGSQYVPAPYWEGAVNAEGVKGGQPVRGPGFVELVGYDTREFESPRLGQGR